MMLTMIPEEAWRWMIVIAFIGLSAWNLFKTGRDK